MAGEYGVKTAIVAMNAFIAQKAFFVFLLLALSRLSSAGLRRQEGETASGRPLRT